jgi:hypothetical protein
MGGGNPGASQMLGTCYHMNGIQKAYQDWLQGCNIVKTGTTGTYVIYPIERACNGVQLLQIPLPASRRISFPPSPIATITSATLTAYYLELRAPVGLDRGLATPRVFVMAAGNLKDARLRGNANWLIDTVPETRTVADAHLAVGKTFVDPAPGGPKFTVVSADETKAVISVQLDGEGESQTPGNGTCSDDSVFTGPGPSNCQAAPGSSGGGGSGGSGQGGAGAGGAGGSGGSGGGDPGGSTPIARDAGTADTGSSRPAADARSSGGGGGDAADESPPARVVAAGCGCRLGARPGGAGDASDGALGAGVVSGLGLVLLSIRSRRRRAGTRTARSARGR